MKIVKASVSKWSSNNGYTVDVLCNTVKNKNVMGKFGKRKKE